MNKKAFILGFSCFSLLASCAHHPDSSTTPVAVVATPTTEKPFKAETLFSLMVAELAANQQEFDLTLGNYLEQAHKTRDLGVIARATRISQFLDARQATFDMGLLWLSVKPDSVDANLVVAEELLRQKRPVNALANVEQVFAIEDNPILENLAVQANSLDKASKTGLIKQIQQLQTRYPTYPSIPVSLAILYSQDKRVPEASQAITQALKINAQYPPAIIQRARLLHDGKSPEAASAYLKKKVEQNPKNPQLRLMYARLLTKTDTEAAYEQFSTLSSQSPNQPDIAFSKALTALEIGKLKEAQSLLSRLNSIQYRPNILPFYLGLTEEKLGNKSAAIKAYLSTVPGDEYINAQSRVFFLWAEQGELARAQAYFDQLRSQYPEQAKTLYNNQAQSLISLKKYAAAEQTLDQALREYPDDVSLYYSRAVVREKTDQLDAMEQDFRQALAIKPGHVASLNALGYILTDRTQRFDEALILIEQAHAKKPDDPAILDSLGWVHYKLGNYDRAIQYLKKAYAGMKDPEVANHLGEALWANNQRAQAKAIWNDFPEDPDIIDTIKRLSGS